MLRLHFPISKTEQLSDGRLLVEGTATSDSIDSQKERLLFDGSVEALSKWLETGPAVRESHDPHKAVGRGLEMVPNPTRKTIGVRVFVSAGAPDTQMKVKDGTLSAFSVGGEPKSWTMQKEGNDTIREISAWEMHELSLVDRPANPDCRIDFVKNSRLTDNVGKGEDTVKAAVKKPAPDESEAPKKPAEGEKPTPEEGENKPADEEKPAEEKPEEKAEEPPVAGKKYGSVEEAKAALKADVEACQKEDVAASDARQKARAAIVATAEGFGLADMLPKEWAAKPEKKAKKSGTPSMQKDGEAFVIRTGLDILQMAEGLLASEQYEAMGGQPEPPEQLAALQAVIAAIKVFVASEAGELVAPAAAPTAPVPVELAAKIDGLAKSVGALLQKSAPAPVAPEPDAVLRKTTGETLAKAEDISKAIGDLKALTGEVKALAEVIAKTKFPGGPIRSFTPQMGNAIGGLPADQRIAQLESWLLEADGASRPFLERKLRFAKAQAAQSA